MFIKSEPKNRCQSLNSKNGWLQRIAEYLLSLPRSVKRAVLLSTDLVLSLICLFLALSLRHGYLGNHIGLLALFCYAIIPIIGLYAIGFYKGVARGFFDAVMANVSQLFFLLIILYEVIITFDVFPYMPRSVPIIFLFLFFIWLWNSRLTIRELLTRAQGKNQKRYIDDNDYDNVIIYGAGEAGRELSEGLRNSHKYNVVAYVDDDPQLTGAYLLDKKIHAASELIRLVGKLDVAQVFLAIPSISRARKRQIIDKLSDIAIKIKELPSLEEIADEKVTVSSMRKIDILDVLDRQTVEPDAKLLQMNIKGKCVLVTGAGGSIGSELCRQVIKNQPK